MNPKELELLRTGKVQDAFSTIVAEVAAGCLRAMPTPAACLRLGMEKRRVALAAALECVAEALQAEAELVVLEGKKHVH